MKKTKINKYVDKVTLGEVYDLIKKAYLDGYESDDEFLFAVSLKV